MIAVIAIIGKTVWGSYDDSRSLGAIHIVNAFATANGWQRKIAQKILDKEVDYLLALKGNQGLFEQAFDDYF